MTDLYAVMGNPINHSKSPAIHTQFAEQSKQDIIYSAMLVPIDGFDVAVKDFFKGNGKGLNITVPFKEQAFKLADQLTPRAQTAQAVNTLKLMDDGTILGDNTDGAGVVSDLVTNNQVELKDKRVLVVGAGGAVRGILQPFLEQEPAEIVIVNRTFEKAQALADAFVAMGNIRAMKFEELSDSYDVIVNGTSASLSVDLPPIPDSVINANTVVYDMMYGKEPTPFMDWATRLDARQAIDGLGMLVEQAAVSFSVWRSIKPNGQVVLADLRDQLSK